jgi:hypothetical protein
MKYKSGWINPKGDFIEVGLRGHREYAEQLNCEDFDLYKAGWISCSESFSWPVVNGMVDRASPKAKEIALEWWKLNTSNSFQQSDLIDEIMDENNG